MQRLTIKPVAPADASGLRALFHDPAVRRYLLDDVLVSAEWVRQEIATSEARFASGSAGLWTIRIADRTPIVGFVGFREFFDPPQLQLLYGLLPQFWKQGFATEAAVYACDYAFRHLGFAEVSAATDVPNQASVNVLTRIGMRQIRTTADGPAGTAFFSVTREEWFKA